MAGRFESGHAYSNVTVEGGKAHFGNQYTIGEGYLPTFVGIVTDR